MKVLLGGDRNYHIFYRNLAMSLRSMMFFPITFTACFIDIGTGGSASESTGSDSTASPTGTQSTTIANTSGLETTADPTSADPTSAGPTSSPDVTSAGPTSGPDMTSAGPTSGPDPTVTTANNTSVTASTSSDPSTDTMTTAEVPDPVCGNGMLEPGEDCDDGNDIENDDCRNDCTLSACYDNVHNGDETDVDCGGDFCDPCGICAKCDLGIDCGGLLTCDGGHCSRTWVIELNYGVDCGSDSSEFSAVNLDDYNGDWEITALFGGGYLDVTNPQKYGWLAHCDGFDFGSLQADFTYPSVSAAFDAIDPKVTVSAYVGGPTKCGVFDDQCFNNFGLVKFSLRPLCE